MPLNKSPILLVTGKERGDGGKGFSDLISCKLGDQILEVQALVVGAECASQGDIVERVGRTDAFDAKDLVKGQAKLGEEGKRPAEVDYLPCDGSPLG
ncbi:hypothetical protein SDC9_207430 [bioreactor metagenome]|uniref:Uncharacterized protein n=1 Tax=bioreactor metagenome TaxID=1076179 RepID=A0A645J7S7_9ZZZZ